MGRHPDDWRDDRRVEAVLDDAELLHVAVTTTSGIHVTPTVFDADGRHLWFLAPRRSVKVRAIARHRRVGGLVQVGDRAVMLTGRARIVDPLAGRGIFSLNRLVDLPEVALGYLGRNHRHVVGVVKDNPTPTLPLSRVAVRIEVGRVALLDGDAVTASWGPWNRQELLLCGEPPAGRRLDLNSVPRRLHRLLDGQTAPVVLGWQTCSGPVALPGRWDAARGLVEAGREALTLSGAGSAGPACLTAARWGHSMDRKRGVLIAGPGRARVDGGVVSASITPERVTYWIGDESGTVKLP